MRSKSAYLYKYFIGMGSNLENRTDILESGISDLDQLGRVVNISNWYESDSWGFEGLPFINLVVLLESPLNPDTLIEKLQYIEEKHGRQQSDLGERYANRTLDLDILYADDLIVNSEKLVVPHPRAHLRNFVLTPMCDIDGEFVCPRLGKNMQKLLSESTDSIEVRKLPYLTKFKLKSNNGLTYK